MPSTERIALALLVLGIAFVANPLYVDVLVGDEESRSSQIVGARPLGVDHDGDPIGETKDLVDTWDGEHVLDVQKYAALSARGSTDHLPCNSAVDATVDLMRRATDEGNATTTDEAVAADVRCMAERYDYYYPPDDDQRGLYAFSVASDGEEVRVETRPASEPELAEHVRQRELVRYGSLNDSERATVDRILANSTDEYGGYRPMADDPVLDRTPMLLRKDGTTYVIETVGHTDDFNAGRLFLFFGLTALGLLCLLGGVIVGGYALYRRRHDDGDGGRPDHRGDY